MPQYQHEYPVPLDILDTAVDSILLSSAHSPQWVKFRRHPRTEGSVVYQLRQEHLGDIGTVMLRKTGPGTTLLKVDDPPLQYRSLTPEELAQIEVIGDPEAKRKARARLREKQIREAQELHKRRKEHQRMVIYDLRVKLTEDPWLAGTLEKREGEAGQATAMPGGGSVSKGEQSFKVTPPLEGWPAWMPKRDNLDLLQNWEDIASIWDDMREEYESELHRESPPKLEDLRDKVIEELGVTYSTRRLSTVLRAKEGGYLPEAKRRKGQRI